MGGFSFASVILSYFLVAGGLLSGSLLVTYLKSSSEIVAYLCFAAGSAVGGFVAARASRGSTIIEPTIGAVAVIITIVAMVAGTDLDKLMWHVAPDGTMKFVAALAGCSAAGALAGAFASEKLLGEATLSSVPWVVYAAFSTFGACFIATFIAAVAAIGGKEQNAVETLAKMMLAGAGIGCLLAGLAIGASARTRAMLASLVGGGAGVAGFFLLVTHDSPHDKDTAAGIIVLAVGGAIVTLIGSGIGWAAIGKRSA